MPKQSSSDRNFPTDEQITRLTDAVISLEDQVQELHELAGAVLTLTDQVRCLRHAVDEIEQELGWAIRTKVIDQFPRPDLPCNAYLNPLFAREDVYGLDRPPQEPRSDSLRELESPEEAIGDFEHVYDPEEERWEDVSPPHPSLPESQLPPQPRRQSELW